MLTTSKACRRTLMLKVYMAKLAVLISTPSTHTIHCPSLPCLSELDPHGDWRSDSRTPFSRARLSRRMGMKEPISFVLSVKMSSESTHDRTGRLEPPASQKWMLQASHHFGSFAVYEARAILAKGQSYQFLNYCQIPTNQIMHTTDCRDLPQMTYTSAANPYMYQPASSFWLVGRESSPG